MIYQKGAWVLHMLRTLVGGEVFDEGVRSYYAEFKDRNASTSDFRRHIEEASGRELGWFFDEWLYQGGIPHLNGHWTYDETSGKLALTIQQTQPEYSFRVTPVLELVYEDGSSEHVSIEVTGSAGVEERVEVAKRVVDVIPDPETELLARWDFTQR